jgi:hypothetical protein
MANEKKILCQLAVGKMGYPGAEVARYLGVTTSSVNHLAVSEEATDLKKYLKCFGAYVLPPFWSNS